MTTLYVAMQDSLLVVRGAEKDGRAEPRLGGRRVRSVAADPLRAGRVYCGTFDQGVWRSDDGGESWRRAGAGPGSAQVMAVAVAAGDAAAGAGTMETASADRTRRDAPATVYAGTEPSAVFRSADGGERWSEAGELASLASAATWSFPPRPETHHVRWILPDPVVAGRLFVCIEAGALVRSDDGGRSWLDRAPDGPLDTHTLAAHHAAPGRLYAAAGDGYFESDDAGEHWRRPRSGLRHGYLWGVAVDAGDPDSVLVSAARGPRSAHRAATAESLVYRRIGDGEWRRAGAGLPDPAGTTASVLAAHPSRAGVVYLANNHGVYRSTDAGGGWTRLEVAWPERYRGQRAQGLAVAVESG